MLASKGAYQSTQNAKILLTQLKSTRKYTYFMDPPKPQQTTHPMFTVNKKKKKKKFNFFQVNRPDRVPMCRLK